MAEAARLPDSLSQEDVMIDRYGAWGQATSLRQMMDRLFQDTVVLPGAGNAQQWAGPALDVFEEDDNLIVETHLPGLKPEDIDVQVEQGVLTIAGTTQSEEEKKERNYLMREQRTGRFVRSLQLPAHYLGDPSQATYQDGVLRLIFPKSDAAKPRRIQVATGDHKAMASGRNGAESVTADQKTKKESAKAA
jgi:HSP20 family protein